MVGKNKRRCSSCTTSPLRSSNGVEAGRIGDKKSLIGGWLTIRVPISYINTVHDTELSYTQPINAHAAAEFLHTEVRIHHTDHYDCYHDSDLDFDLDHDQDYTRSICELGGKWVAETDWWKHYHSVLLDTTRKSGYCHEGAIPSGALIGGRRDGMDLYIIRASYAGGVSFTLLSNKIPAGHFHRMGDQMGILFTGLLSAAHAPSKRWDNFVEGGWEADGTRFLIAQVSMDSGLNCGKVKWNDYAYIATNSGEQKFENYAVLVFA
ncbi:hypothetical protein DFJ58DRAFT_836054 [Suillus subalutaceus]|uniref:uncharacterized protein n=1 Tax=Suillus subalutaceus TaxID=48586 RepID=UPI001B878AF1|nr:uncharacterized protein DFJ58DRAFT_836054 [Suillus subalutaceus]KAG1875421.1 hypothetical protein DFJ58DRAFT_836054 [Suillus subalutaceus]